MDDATIAAIATPQGTGGIGMVRLSGPESVAIAGRFFRSHAGKRIAEMAGYTGTLGEIYDGACSLDEGIAFVYRAPKSYTGEDVVELTCHGGGWVTSRVLRLCLDCGARLAEPGEFTRRAFLNGRIDLTQAESVMDVISAEGDRALRAAAEVGRGALSTKIKKIVENLLAESAHLAVWADYPEEDIEAVEQETLAETLSCVLREIEALLATFDRGQILCHGIRTVIAGRPNVGKSTLMNLLSGYESSIVTEIPGTTRDVVSGQVRIGEITLRLYDTAGLRDTDDPVEKIGVSRAREQLEQAQLILAVLDGSGPLEQGDIELLSQSRGRPCVALVNKADLPSRVDLGEIRRLTDHVVCLSALTGEGYDQLAALLEEIAGIADLAPDQTMILNERQRQHLAAAGCSLEQAADALQMQMTLDAVGVCLDEAVDQLLRLTGERVSDRVLEEVFSRFCVGK